MRKFAVIFLLTLCVCNSSYAHGVGFRESKFRATALEFFYSTGEEMSYCEARVFSPNDAKFAAQTGRTDEQGRLAFIPDVPGEWRVIVRDNEGHQCEARVNVSETLSASVHEESGDDLWFRALLGVSIIFNIAMIIRWRTSHAH